MNNNIGFRTNGLGGSANRWRILCTLCIGLITAIACSVWQGKPSEPQLTTTPVHFVVPTALSQVTPFTPSGRVYYVAVNEPGASDSNNGLHPTYQGGQDGPWLTIQHAADTVTAGDTIYVRGGVYYESSIVFANSGEPERPIALVGFDAEDAIIDGSQAADDYYPGIVIDKGQSHYVIQGLTIRNMPWSGISTEPETAKHYQDITIRDCVLHDNGWSGIDLAAIDGFVIENIEAYGNTHYGTNITGSEDGTISAANGAVRNSRFHDHTGKEGHGLAINQGHDIIVSDSVAYHNTIHGFDVSDWPKFGELSHHIVFERDFSYDNGVAGFAINSDSHHVAYWNNVAWQNGAAWAGPGSSSGFLCYEGCWHVEWYNNISVENTDAGFYVEDALGDYGVPNDSTLAFKNNIAYNNGRPGSDERPALVVDGEQWEVVATHNNWGGTSERNAWVVGVNLVGSRGELYTSADINGGAFQLSNISVDPEFVDMMAADWRLRPESPMIDAGTDVGKPFCGIAPDMGAIEVCP